MFGNADLIPFLIPLLVGLYLIRLLWTRPGEPPRDSATVQYEPPASLTPAECGVLLDNEVDVRCITATIVDLSIKGFLTIDQKDAERARGEQPAGSDYYFHMAKPLNEWRTLKPHESLVATAIFVPTNPVQLFSEAMSEMQNLSGATPELAERYAQLQATIAGFPGLSALSQPAPQSSAGLAELRQHFPLHLPTIRRAVFQELQRAGYYAGRPDQIRLRYTAAAVVAGVLVLAIGVLAGMVGAEVLPWLLSAAITALMIWVVGLILPARSATGAKALGQLRGFREFLGRVEKGRVEKLDDSPQLFEKFLPYAMALGVERRWAEAFTQIAVVPPWYRGGGGDLWHVQFVSDLNASPGQARGVKSPEGD